MNRPKISTGWASFQLLIPAALITFSSESWFSLLNTKMVAIVVASGNITNRK